VIGVLVGDACVQAAHVVNQSVIYGLLPGARSRLTTIYMTMYFIGGALGSAGGSQAYERWGWAGASITAAGSMVPGLVAWVADYREREDGLRTAARASRAVGTRA
jgi:predicted MFS family arabinose efflux permease